MEFIVIAALLGLIPAYIAKSKGRENVFGWWIYGALLWIVALIHALCMTNLSDKTAKGEPIPKGTTRPCSNPSCMRVLTGGQTKCKCGTITPLPVPAQQDDTRECPKCAELIKKKAKKCKHCGTDVEPIEEV